jgi:hypothetical protein
LLPAASSASAGTRVLDTPNEPTTNGSAINGSAENGSATTGEALDVAASGNAAGGDEQLSPAEVEMRRARQLLDRSFSLSERGDLAGAILACRQAISLVPDLAEAHSMLGLLLERTGDTKGAIEAYEETLLLAPDSLLERDSLQRLRAQMPQQSATPFFRFDDSELFPETPGAANDFMTPASNGVATEAVPDGAAVAAASSAESESADALPSTQTSGVAPAVATGAVVAATAAASAGSASASEISPGAVPEATTASVAPALTASATNTAASTSPSAYSPVYSPAATAATASAPATPLDFGVHSTPVRAGEPWWQTARSRPSFYLRALPLTGVAVAGLMFMMWARNVADNRNAAVAPTYVSEATAPDGTNTNAPTQEANANGTATTANTPGATGTPAAPDGITGSNVPITNDWRTVPPNAPAATGTTSTGAPTGTGQTGATQGSLSAGQAPTRSTQGGGARPAGLPSISGNDSPRRDRGAPASGAGPAQPFDGIPPARILNTPAAPEVVQAVPSGDGGATTSGGGPVNPAVPLVAVRCA